MICRKWTKTATIKVESQYFCSQLQIQNSSSFAHSLTLLLSGGCSLEVLESYLKELGHQKKRNHSLGESIEKGDLKIEDITENFGPYFSKMDIAMKLFAIRIWFKKPFLSGKKELKLLLNSYLLKTILEFASEDWLTKYWDYKISSKPHALSSDDRVWRIVTAERGNRLDAGLKMFSTSSSSFAFGSLSDFVAHIPKEKSTVLLPRGGGANAKPFLGISSW